MIVAFVTVVTACHRLSGQSRCHRLSPLSPSVTCARENLKSPSSNNRSQRPLAPSLVQSPQVTDGDNGDSQKTRPLGLTRTNNHADTGRFQKRKADSPPAPIDRSTNLRTKICDEPTPPLAQFSLYAARSMSRPAPSIIRWVTAARCESWNCKRRARNAPTFFRLPPRCARSAPASSSAVVLPAAKSTSDRLPRRRRRLAHGHRPGSWSERQNLAGSVERCNAGRSPNRQKQICRQIRIFWHC
jgi:hypothetical protein